jgi:hypothetical protein
MSNALPKQLARFACPAYKAKHLGALQALVNEGVDKEKSKGERGEVGVAGVAGADGSGGTAAIVLYIVSSSIALVLVFLEVKRRRDASAASANALMQY